MAASSWLKWFKGNRSPSKKPVPRRAFVPRLESLEDRTVLSTYWVNTSADTVDSNPKVTSLREAIEKANGTPGVADIIRFKPRAWGTITLDEARGQLAIADDLKILGPGAELVKVSGGDKVRVFYVHPNTTATIARLTITHGHAENHETILGNHGGGLLNDGNLTLTGVVVSHNKAVGVIDGVAEPRHLGGAGGGGVGNRGNLTATGCTFFDNQALGVDGQIGVLAVPPPTTPPTPPNLSVVKFPGMGIGGGLWNWVTGVATITGSRFIDNVARGGSNGRGTFAGLGQGGAIYNDNRLTVTGTVFSGNQAIGGSHTFSDIFSGEAVGGAISSAGRRRVQRYRLDHDCDLQQNHAQPRTGRQGRCGW
jgi:CSLREA domain-containing protein